MGEKFRRSYALVRPTEELFANFYRYQGFDVAMNDDYRYDLVLSKNGRVVTTIEIKEQFKIDRWQAALVEYMNRGKPSGIAATLSKHWIEVLHFGDIIKYYITETENIKHLIREERYLDKIKGGDDKQSNLYKFNIDVYTSIFKPATQFLEYKKMRGI